MKNSLSVFALLLLLASVGCKKSSSTVSPLKGNVLLFDEGNSTTDLSGMKVSIENSNPLVSALTDQSGNFVLPVSNSLPSFTLDYSKAGYGMFKRNYTKDASGSFVMLDMYNQPSQNSLSASESLGAASSVTINTFQAAIHGDTLKILCNISSPNTNGEKYVRVLFQKDLPDISINTVGKSNYSDWSHLFPVQNGDNTISLCLKCSSICAGWQPGDQVYMTGYGDSYYSNIYTDHVTGTLMFPNLNLNSKAVPVSIIVPVPAP